MRVLLTGASGLFGANFLWQYHTRFDLIADIFEHRLISAINTQIITAVIKHDQITIASHPSRRHHTPSSYCFNVPAFCGFNK